MPPFDFIEDPELRQKAVDEYTKSVEISKAETAKLIEAEIEKATSGLKLSQQKILDEKKKLQERYSKIADPEAALKALALIEGNEEVRLLAEGKIDDVLQRRMSAVTTQYEQDMEALKTKFESADMSSTKYSSMYKDVVLDTVLRRHAAEAGVVQTSMVDLLARGKNVFKLAEDEVTLESRDANGKLIKTDDDKVLTPQLWIESLKKTAPHFWPQSRSAGFNPGSGGADDLSAAIAQAAKDQNHGLFRELREKQRKLKAK